MKVKRYCAIILILGLYACETHTYEELEGPLGVQGNVNYTEHIQPLVAANCLSCHGGGGVSSFRPLGTYAALKEAVLTTNLLDRIQRANGEPGQMPQTGRMPQANIDLILQWNENGLPEN